MNKNKLISNIKKRIAEYKDVLAEMVLLECNTIIVLNELHTVTVGDDGKLTSTTSFKPMQFSEESAERICKQKWSNGHETIQPKAVGWRKWYADKLANLEAMLEGLENQEA